MSDPVFYTGGYVDGDDLRHGSKQSMWVSTADLPRDGGHPFFDRLNRILDAAGFDAFVEGAVCAVLRADGAAGSGAGPIFPAVAHRVLRRTGLRASQSRGGRRTH